MQLLGSNCDRIYEYEATSSYGAAGDGFSAAGFFNGAEVKRLRSGLTAPPEAVELWGHEGCEGTGHNAMLLLIALEGILCVGCWI